MYNFIGGVEIHSSFSLEELALIISKEIISGLEFGGKELQIHDEIPCVFIPTLILGLSVELDEITSTDNRRYYILQISNRLFPHIEGTKTELLNIDDYLYYVFKESLKDYSNILIKVRTNE
jgi:hypothetical protein